LAGLGTKLAKLDFTPPKSSVEANLEADTAGASGALDSAEKFARSESAQKLELATRRAVRETDATAGRPIYGRYCAACHGDAGTGFGEAAGSLKTRPRDFRRGEYKFRSTKSGALPTEDDLFRTITAGIPGTDMPAWRNILSAAERRALARYVTTFSTRFLYAPAPVPVVIPPETPNSAQSVERGRELYVRLQCAQCHGTDGRAGGASQKMFDDWGAPIDATDLTRGVYKAGSKPEDRYRTLVTGLSGTPMPSFGEMIGPGEVWDLVHFVDSLADGDGLRELLGVP
jgi:mono/diheme cytochrome c family protein